MKPVRNLSGKPELPSNVPILLEGYVSIRVFRDNIWVQLIDDGVDVDALDKPMTVIKFCEVWRDRAAAAEPRNEIRIRSEPGDAPALIDLSHNHPRPAVLKNVMRIGQEVNRQWGDWLVYAGSDEAVAMHAKYDPKRIFPRGEGTVPGAS
jgi:hypothetical protein